MKTNYLQFPVIRELSASTLKKSFKKRDKFIKDLKDPKFRRKAKIKDYKGKIYRQTTGKAEENIFNKNSWVMNPVLNLQSLNPHKFQDLRNLAEERHELKSLLSRLSLENDNICEECHYFDSSVKENLIGSSIKGYWDLDKILTLFPIFKEIILFISP